MSVSYFSEVFLVGTNLVLKDWAGKISQTELLAEAKRLRLAHWKIQKDAGVDIIPSNDFALYDQVLAHIQDFGVSKPPQPIKFLIDNPTDIPMP